MTGDEFATRYELRTQLRSGGIESWLGVSRDTQRPVMVHRLITSARTSVLDMISHLEPNTRARILEQLVVDDLPIVVTEQLAPFTSFIEWLQNSIPATVSAIAPPPAPPPAAATAPSKTPPGESLTQVFLGPLTPAPAPPAPATVSPPLAFVPVQPPVMAPPGAPPPMSLSSVFQAPTPFAPIGLPQPAQAPQPPQLSQFPGAATPPAQSPSLPLSDQYRWPVSQAEPMFAPPPLSSQPPAGAQPYDLNQPFPSFSTQPSPLSVPPAPTFPAPLRQPPLGMPMSAAPKPLSPTAVFSPMGPPPGRTSDGAAPNFRDGFLDVEPPPALPMRQRQALGMGDMPLPRLDASKGSSFTQIIRPAAQPGLSGMPAKPDLAAPPAAAPRPPSALPLIVAVSLLVVGVVVVLLVVALGKH